MIDYFDAKTSQRYAKSPYMSTVKYFLKTQAMNKAIFLNHKVHSISLFFVFDSSVKSDSHYTMVNTNMSKLK